MPNTPHQRNTRSNSNTNTQITLLDIKTLIEKSKQDMLEVLAEKMDNQTKMIDSLVKQIEEMTKVNKSLKKKNEILEERIESLSSSVIEEMEDRIRRQKNIIISGISEERSGSIDERRRIEVEKVEEIMQQLSVDADRDDITSIHRIGKPGRAIDLLLVC